MSEEPCRESVFQTVNLRTRIMENNNIPLPTDPSGVYSKLMTDTDLVLAKKRFVKVSGVGELIFEPDSIEFVVKIIAIKPSLIDARTSIKKREEYILAAMKKNHIREIDVVSNEMVKRVNSDNTEDEDLDGPVVQDETDTARYEPPVPKYFRVCKELHAHCDNLMKYLHISSLCNEKLDQYVSMSQPVIKFTPGVLQLYTQRAIRQAMTVAHGTAAELVGTHKPSNVSLGPMMYAVQDSCTTQPLVEYSNSNFESLRWKGFNQRISCKVTVVYEIVNKQTSKRVM